MNHISTLTRSRWLLLTLFTLLVGVSPAWGQKSLPYNYGFETDLDAEGWTRESNNTDSRRYTYESTSAYEGSCLFKFKYNTNPPQYLISPELEETTNSVSVSFYYRAYNTSNEESFKVGYSTTNNNIASFTWDDEIKTKSTTYTQYSKTLPAGTKYVSIQYTANDKYYLFIDNFNVTENEQYPKPTDFAFTGYTSTTATFSWTNGGVETAWQIAYSTTQGFDAGSVSPVDVTANPYTLEGLTAETTYYARIRADYGGGNYSNWSDEISFKPSAAINTLVNNGAATNGYVPFYGSYADTDGTMSQFIIPSTSLTEVQNRQITKLTFYDSSASIDFGSAKFKVYLKETTESSFESSTCDWEGMEEVADVAVSVSDNKMEITLESPFDYSDGNLMVGFKLSATGTWKTTNWVGVSATSTARYQYSSSKSIASFLPKMTITSLPQTSAPKMKVEAEDSYDFKFLTSTSTAEDKSATFEVQNKGNAALTDANVSYTGDAAIAVSPNGALASIDAKGSTEISITVDTETPDTYAGTITVTGTGSDDVVIPVKAIVRNTDKLFIDFDENNPKPAAWTLGSGWSVNSTNSIATIGNTTAAITTSEILSAGETLTLRYRGNYDGDGASLAVSYSTTTVDGDYTDAVETVSSIGYYVWKYATFTIPATAKFVKVTGKYIDLDAFYGLQAAAVPVVVLSTTSHNFGLVSNADTQALTLTISNEGGAALNGLTVTPTSGFAVTDMEGNALTTNTIAAGSSLNVKVKMNAVGQQNGTVTISGTGVDAQEVTVSGYMLDDSKITETFASLPNRWTKTGTWSFNASTGASTSNYVTGTMTSPKIKVTEGEALTISAKVAYAGSYYYLKIEGSADNGSTWTAYSKQLDTTSEPALSTSAFTVVSLTDIPTTVNRLRITSYFSYINALNGFTYAADPVLSLYSDEDCTVAQAATATKNFGFVAEAQQQKYYIKNTGTGQIDLTIEQADGFTAAVDDAALTENEKATLTINMAATEGLHDGTITVTAKNHDTDAVLGTFEVALNGAVAGSKNDVNFASLSDVPAGWDKGSWTVTENSYVQNTTGTAQELTTATYTVGAGETLLVEAQGTSSYNETTLTYSYKAGEADWTEAVSIGTVTYNNWKVYAITGVPTGDAKVKFSGTYVRIRRIYGFTAKVEPFMVFAEDGTTKSFGMITAKATSDAYTITNSGTALLDNLSVTCNNANFEIAVADNATSIAAGGNVTFTVALKTTALGSQSGTVTIAGTGVESKTLNVKGYVADNTKIFTTFTALPDRWTNSSWTFDANGATATSSSSKLETPKIIVAEGQKLAISAKLQYSGSYYVTINGSSDNGATWTAYTKTLNNAQLNNTDYTVVELDDVPTTVNKIRLIGYYVYVNGLNGFTYDENDPEFSLFSDEECNTPIATATVTNAWGFVNEDKTATYYIKNTGTGTLNLSKTDAPTGFTATLGATSLTAGEKTSLTIAMANNSATNEGYHAGDVVLTAKDNSNNTLGTFTVTSSGVVVGSKTDINFTTLDAFPAGWETTGWSVTANTKATTSSTNKTLTTGTYTVAAGEKLVIEGKGNYSWYSPSLTYEYSTDGGSSWTAGESTLSYTYSASDYQLQVIDDIPAGTAKIKFTGSYMDIRRIYGFTAVLEPAMTLSPAAASYDFGMQTAAAEYVITVTNSGTAEMTGLAAALTGDDADDFEVAVSKTTVPCTGENTATVTVTLKASTEYKDHNATLTISADGLADKVITLKGKTRDASKNYIDFASEIPSSFVEKGSWSVSSQYATTTSSTENSLITQPIDLAAGEKVYFDAYNPYSGSLKVRYSVNGGISWSDYTDYTASINTSGSYSSHEIDLENASAVTAVIEFKGRYYIQLDNVYGGVLNNEAPMIKVTKSAAVVESGATEAFGSISAEATATYAITNVGNGTLTITDPVTKTGAATVTVNKTSLANGESATLTITMPVEAPYEYKEGVVTVVTNLGNFVIDYNATVLNPNALDEQFASGKPTGWYFGEYWKVSGEQAMQEDSGTPKDLITEQLTVAGTSDVLTFQAARTSSYSAPTFNVYTSQDRVTWNAVDLGELTLTTSYQDVNISGLAAGDYYVKITGARVKVDNFLGWTKKNNTRDLYVTATSFPATTDKGESATISATVTSLRAAETGVYAKLFIDGTEEETAAAQDIALNGTKTFSFSYAIPENKTAQIKVYYSNADEAFVTAENAMRVNYTLEQTSLEAITAGTFNVTLDRTFVAGWNTICLPFAVTATEMKANYGENVALYELTSFTDGNLQFTKLGEEIGIAAGKPYLIYVEDAITESKTFVDATISATSPVNTVLSGVTFHGTFAPIAAGGVLTGKYGISSDGRIAKANNATYMNGFRGYLEGSLAGARISIFDEATGISRIYDADEVFGKDAKVYNLNGQKVENAKKGLYIVNGRKVVVK